MDLVKQLQILAAAAGIYVPEESCSEQAAGNLRKFHNRGPEKIYHKKEGHIMYEQMYPSFLNWLFMHFSVPDPDL